MVPDALGRCGVSGDVMCIRGRGGRGKEHIGIGPDAGTSLWTRTACGLTCLPQYPGYWAQASEAEKCWNCKAFHEMRLTLRDEEQSA